ncbi:VOC family protein [Chitiniphilus eburneus]|uniref:VOC family protein n=1 Tax=Chitiniphilus eburneus TaxID=2571148 RepID=A0A4U0PY63_9NEIS|nr:VOC family protein [Chitiniphilus eburneus]TJZ73551.1 VOC family protein [Chitiniphilus eburneus]
MSVQAIPTGYEGVVPYLFVHDGVAALDFYRDAFGAEELFRMMHQGQLGHAEVKIGGRVVMLAAEYPDMDALGPLARGGSTVGLMVYVPDCDAACQRAEAAGATVRNKPENKFYGDRSATVVDPFGHVWYLSTHVEDVPPDELERRMKAECG